MQESYKDHIIHIAQDTDAESPREWGGVGTMVCFHKRYRLGDTDAPRLSPSDFEGWEDMERHLYEHENAALVLPLYLYDHGGLSMRTTPFDCRWDSGQIGFIYAAKERAAAEGVVDLSDLRRRLEGEVVAYNTYLMGEVYYFSVEGERCEESCGGFYGINDAIIEAKALIDAATRHANEVSDEAHP